MSGAGDTPPGPGADAGQPRQLGKYRIDSVLGKGAMGMVYQAYDPHIARAVALKTIRKELFGADQQQELIGRFQNEAQAAGRLTHPNIVAVYDYGEDDTSAYIAMEFVEGTALNAVLAAGPAPTLEQALVWMTQLLGALDYAHARGVVHRDIKPANLLVTATTQLKISDFGIARVDTSTLTQTGAMIGTPSYMSPEQFRGDPVDGRSDVFSAAIVLYQLVTGTRPFSGSATVVMQQILNQMPAPPSSVNPALAPALDAVLARALAKPVHARYQSAQAFLDALLALAPLDPGQVTASLPPPRRAPLDDDSTVLVAAPPASLADHGPQQPDHTDALTGWRRDSLPELESLLSHQIGPLAKFLVKKMAAQAADLEAVCSALLPHIPSERGRQQFADGSMALRRRLAAAQRNASSVTNGSNGTNGTNGTGGSALASATGTDLGAINDTTRYIAEHHLTLLIGPIARVVVARAARRATDHAGFLQLLLEHIPQAEQHAAFLRAAGGAP